MPGLTAAPDDAARLMTAVEVADLLRVAPSYIYRCARENRIPVVRLAGGRYVRFDRREIAEWITGRDKR